MALTGKPLSPRTEMGAEADAGPSSAVARPRAPLGRKKREQEINTVNHYYATIEQGGSTFKVIDSRPPAAPHLNFRGTCWNKCLTGQRFPVNQIHFIYEESKDPNAIPLLLLHGWP